MFFQRSIFETIYHRNLGLYSCTFVQISSHHNSRVINYAHRAFIRLFADPKDTFNLLKSMLNHFMVFLCLSLGDKILAIFRKTQRSIDHVNHHSNRVPSSNLTAVFFPRCIGIMPNFAIIYSPSLWVVAECFFD